jgi:AraC-like DNA-binding protein
VVRPEGLEPRLDRVLLPGRGVLAEWVDHIWSLSWPAPIPGSLSGVISHPAVHLTVENGPPGEVRHGHPLPAALLHGVVTRPFSIDLPGPGWVVGLHLTPGAAFDLTGTPAHVWTGQVSAWANAWPGWDLSSVWEATDVQARAQALETAAQSVIGTRRPSAAGHRARKAERLARTDRTIRSTEELAARIAVSPRSLQRLCREHLGVTPLWLLRRARVLEAHQLLSETDLDVAEIAQLLGWYDQAHLTRDYTKVTGTPPARLRQTRNDDQSGAAESPSGLRGRHGSLRPSRAAAAGRVGIIR